MKITGRTLGKGMVAFGLVVGLVGAGSTVGADANSQLTQTIDSGNLSTSILDGSGNVVVSPTFAMSAITASTEQQTSTGVFGDNTQRITVDNASGSGAWTLTINATTPGTATWTSGSDTYKYNGTAAEGQLTLNPAAGTITVNGAGSTTGITLGSSTAFSGTTPITLATAAASADPIWNGYITGVGVSQTIPASQALGSYTLDLTQTVAAV